MLQALRVFANQAAAALDSAGRFQEMRFLAEHDPLTRLLNRRAFTTRLKAEIARSQRHSHEFALVLCDLDGFKQINDREGHLAGDEILNHAAAVLGAAVRAEDTPFRVGGDEFALILAETTAAEARPVVERLAGALAGAADRPLSASFGVSVFPRDGGGHDALFRAADAAMYTGNPLRKP
jgi:diguanylate cyclase (GGDEF)-like protein